MKAYRLLPEVSRGQVSDSVSFIQVNLDPPFSLFGLGYPIYNHIQLKQVITTVAQKFTSSNMTFIT